MLGIWPAPARAGFSAAAGAATAEMNEIVLDPEFSRVDLGPREVVKARIFHVNNAPAVQTDKVVMLMELGIEARRRSRVAGLGHQAEGHECAQDPVDRHPGNLGQYS